MSLTQTNRPLTIRSPLDDDTLLLNRVDWLQQLGRPSTGIVEMSSAQGDIDSADLLGQMVSITWEAETDHPIYLHGYISEFALQRFTAGIYEYRASIVPWIDLLKHAVGSQIFQQMSVVEITKEIVQTRGFSGELEDRLSGTYKPRAFCVQYGESDYQFLSRLWEQEGIYYFFEYNEDQQTLILCDDVGAHQPASDLESLPYHTHLEPGSEVCVSQWSSEQRFLTGSFVLKDYDFQKPRTDLTVRQNASASVSQWQQFEYPGGYFETDDGQQFARIRSEAAIASQQQTTVQINAAGLHSGNLVTITDHPVDSLNQQYLVTGSRWNLSVADLTAGSTTQPSLSFSGSVQIQPSSLPYRSTATTPSPVMSGPQIATVVGPADSEIWTDQFGRIKVQFAWDSPEQSDDSCSCWIRVLQPWTGKGWGAVAVPRIGEEVIVQFLDGNVDRPLVIGRVFNADRMPPDDLADSQAKTIFRTRSTPDGDIDCFHELTFDDTKDAEQIYLRSERDFLRIVENNDSLKVGFEKQDGGDQSIEIYNDQQTSIGVGSGQGSQTIEIAKDRTTTIQTGDDALTIQQGDHRLTATEGSVTVEAKTRMTLKCGESTIELTPSGIVIKATKIDLQGQTQVNLAASQIAATADASLQMSANAQAELKSAGNVTVQGAMVMIN